MNISSAEILEFPRLKDLIGRFVASAMGKALVKELEPSTDRKWLEASLKEVAETIAFVREAAKPKAGGQGATRANFASLPEVRESVARLRIEGAGLDAEEIRDLITLMSLAGDVRVQILDAGPSVPRLEEYARRLADFRPLLRNLVGKFTADGALADDASPALARIRREREKHERHVQESLERFLKQHSQDHILQEDFVTVRNDRFVVPIVAAQSSRVPGVVHGASSSGQTVFVEPLETIALNNELVQLHEQELQEIHRILNEMTARLREQAPEIQEASNVLARLDYLFGLADFAEAFSCTVPSFADSDTPRLILKAARHPLLEDVFRRQKNKVAPVSFALEPDRRVLLISGPNTGGKSVTMKTGGLLSLMAQSGLPVPAEEAQFPIFDQVLADVGDNQSIQESLSTFSAHVGKIKQIVETVSSDSLVLLDELGRATDPEEGGALGVAILDDLRAVGAFVLASTHLTQLKVYGATTDGVLNGSMGFDEETLFPTYRLRLGVPGKSAGLAIAKRLGLPELLIDRAYGALSRRDADLGRLLADLERRLDEVQTLEKSLRAREAALAEQETTWQARAERREEVRLREIESRLDEVIARFDDDARQAIASLAQASEQRKAADRAARQVSKQKREFREQFATVVQEFRPEIAAGAAPAELELGQMVRIRDVGQPARVARLLANDVVEVESGLIKLQIPRQDVLEILPPQTSSPSKRLPTGVRYQPAASDYAPVSREINVIGKYPDEAQDTVERFLDQASLAGVERVRIIHGFGKGVLQRVVSDLLARHPLVARHYPADPERGGGGATVAELK